MSDGYDDAFERVMGERLLSRPLPDTDPSERRLMQLEVFTDWCHDNGLDPDDEDSQAEYDDWNTRTQGGMYE